MNAIPPSPKLSEAAPIADQKNWRKYFTRQRLRLFLIVSIAAHLVLGMSWGVPAYIKQRRVDAALRQEEALRDQQRKAAEAALAAAKARNLQQTAREVAEQTHKVFDSITADMKQADKEKTWSSVEPKVQPAEQQLANALGDRAMTQQDLSNMQDDLKRQLVEAINDTINVDVGQEEADSFLAAVEARVVPELVAHYKLQIVAKVAQPVHSAADAFVTSTRQEAEKQVAASDADLHALPAAANTLRDELDAASGLADKAQGLGAGSFKGDGPAQLSAAGVHLASASKAAESASTAISKLSDAHQLGAGPETAGSLTALARTLDSARASIKVAQASLADGKTADASRELTALVLAARKVGSESSNVQDAGGRLALAAEQSARGAIGSTKDKQVPGHVDQNLVKAFDQGASARLAGALAGAFGKRLSAAGNKPQEASIAIIQQRVKLLLEKKIAEAGGYGASTAEALRDPAGAATPLSGAAGDRLATQFEDAAWPIIKTGVNDVVADASLDAHLAELVEKPDLDPGRDDVRDRVAMMAASAKAGRTGGADTVSFTDLRASALDRAANLDKSGAFSPDSTSATTEPAEAVPVIDDIKKEILAALKKELQKVLDNKLPDDKAAKVWDQVAKTSDADVSRLAQDLIDPNVSDSDLESRRLNFSGKFLDSVRGALDKSASSEVSAALIKQLQGQAGDAVGEAYKGAIKETVGKGVAREWSGSAAAERSAADQRVRDIRNALESAKAVTAESAKILDQVKEQTGSAVQAGKGDAATINEAIGSGRAKVREVAAAVAGAKHDLENAEKAVPAQAAELKARLGEIAAASDKLADALSVADKNGKDQDAPAFQKAVANARAQVEKFQSTLQGGDEGLNKEGDQAEARFVKAAEQAKGDSASGGPGVKSRIEGNFDGEFRKEALPRLTKQILKGYEQKLDQAGVSPDPADAAALERAIAEALDKKVTGEAHVGEAALTDLDKQNFFDKSKIAAGEPSKEASERANSAADKAIKEGVAATIGGNAADGQIGATVGSLAGPPREIGELKDKVSRLQGQLRGGRGGVLADDADNSDAQIPGGIAGLRRKWRGLLAGLDGDGDGSGNGKAGAHAAAGGATAGAGAQSGTGAAGGGSGAGGGAGAGAGVGGKHGTGGRPLHFDEEQYKKLMAMLKNRGTEQGQAWDRNGAVGQADRAERDRDAVHPAAIVAASTQPAVQPKNDRPYKPAFKSLQFTVVPYLNRPMPIGQSFDAWKDIPAIYLQPERAEIKGRDNLKVVDKLPVKMAWDNHGLYFMLDMTEAADGGIKKAPVVEKFPFSSVFEVFLDTMNTKETKRGKGAGQQFWIWPAGMMADENVAGGESLYDRHAGFHYVPFSLKELPRAAVVTSGGYRLQCCLPTERVRDADLVPGKILGLNLTVETNASLHYYWSASKLAGTWARPDTWGDILLGGSDGRMEFPARLASEAGPKAAEKTVTAFVVGEPLRIRVIDGDMNLNDRVKDKISVTVRNARGEQEVAILEETEADTGIFEGSVRTGLAIGERTPGVLSVYEGEALSVSYIDQARANGARNTEIVSRIKAGPSVMNAATK